MQGDSGCGEESAACAASAGKDIREAETGSGGSAVRAAACGTTAEYGGLVLVGSHVKKTTAQLETLRGTRSPVAFVEFHVNACLLPDGLEEETRRVIRRAEALMGQGKTAHGTGRYVRGPAAGIIGTDFRCCDRSGGRTDQAAPVSYRKGRHHFQRCGNQGLRGKKGPCAGTGSSRHSCVEDGAGE